MRYDFQQRESMRLGGYLNPGEDPQEFRLHSTFEEQFEWVEGGVNFRRFGRGRPVRISYDERDNAIEQFEKFTQLGTMAAVGAWIAWVVFLVWFDADPASLTHLFGLAGIWGGYLLFQEWLWRRLIAPFERRMPHGPPIKIIDQYRSRAKTVSWASLLVGTPFAGLLLWLYIGTGTPINFGHLAEAGVGLVTIAIFISLKLSRQRG